MARKPWLDSAGCLHHVMARGNARAAIFIDDEDRREFLRLLADGVDRFGRSIHAYCLMGNHFQLAVRTGDVPLSKIMQNLLFRFTRHVNRRYGRIGHLFQGRFKSILVDEQSYLLELVRYIQRLHFQRTKAVYTAPSLECVIARVCFAENTSEDALRRVGQERGRAQARALVALLAQDEKVATMTEVAGRFGRDVTTPSRSVANLRERLRKDSALAQKVRALKKTLSNE